MIDPAAPMTSPRLGHDLRARHRRAAGSQVVQALADEVSPDQVERESQGQRHQDEAAGDVALGDVGAEGDQRRDPQEGSEDPFELGLTGSDEAAFVGPVHRHHQHPGQRQGHRQLGVADGERAGGDSRTEPEDQSADDRQGRRHEVDGNQANLIAEHPLGSLRGRHGAGGGEALGGFEIDNRRRGQGHVSGARRGERRAVLGRRFR